MFIKAVYLIITILGGAVIPGNVSREKPVVPPEVFIVGSIHSMHYNPDYHYSVTDLLEQIRALKPDVVCGEIAPEAFDQVTEGYYPPEAALLAEMAPVFNYRFVPVDWRLDYAAQASADSIYPASVKEALATFGNTYFTAMNDSACQSVYDAIHSETNIAIIDSVFEQIIGADSIAEIAHGKWRERNRRIAENGMNAAGDAKRIVFVFGSDHIPGIRRQLRILGYEPQIPERRFVPDKNNTVPDGVIKRWKRNLENLRLIRDRKITVTDDYYQKILNSRRIGELEQAILKTEVKVY
jgi:DNA-binding protein Fis